MFSAIVFSPGRTGSHIIMDNLCVHFKIPRLFDTLNSVPGVLHTHNPYCAPIREDSIAVLSTRKNKLESILSTILISKTSEVQRYTNKPVKKFTVDRDTLWNHYLYHTVFFHLIDKTKFKTVVEVEYESMLSDPKYLFSKFGINSDIKFYGKKSPYDYYQLIENINEVKELFLEFEKVELTDEMISFVKNNIELDLQQLKI